MNRSTWIGSRGRAGLRGATAVLLVAFVAGCGKNGNGGGGPMDPTPMVTSVTVGYPAGGTIFIGANVQFQAQEMLSNGTSRVSTNATWRSDSPAVATVSATGVVTAVGAGLVTISASVANVPGGLLQVRVYPNFAGSWLGSEVTTLCEESGVFVGIVCTPDGFGVGTTFSHRVSFTQAEASVGADIDFGAGQSTTTTGTVSVGGELALVDAPVLPAVEGLEIQTKNWRTRSDVPGQLTGSYEWVLTAPGLPGSAREVSELRNVVRTPAGVASVGVGGAGRDRTDDLSRIASQIGKR